LAIGDDVVFSRNEIIAGSVFILPTTDALYCMCICENTWHDHITCFDQDMSFSNVITLEKQAFMAVEEALVSICTSGFSVSADSHNYRHDALGDWSRRKL